jgi:enoyl-CoA hydratase/carnithine racemase
MLEIRHVEGIIHVDWTPCIEPAPIEALLNMTAHAEEPSEARAIVFHLQTDTPGTTPTEARKLIRLHRHLDRTMTRIERLEIPTVSVLHGDVGGIGLQIALVTDLRVATVGTSIRIDLLEGGGLPGAALARLPKYIGLGRARRMLLFGEVLSVDDALALGIVDRSSEDPETTWPPLLERLLDMPPLTVSMVRRILKGSFRADMEEARATFRAALFQIAGDASEGDKP